MTKLERDIEQALVRLVRRHGGLCLKWVCPGWAGVPDRIILLPGGRVCFAELKRPKGGTLSPLQKYWRRTLEGLGFRCWVLYNDENLRAFEEKLVSVPRSGGF